MFPQSFIDDLRLQANILQVVQEYVPLKRAGTSYKGLCPFHGEKTPSFVVHPDKGFFHCFGCGVGGDVFKFLELHEKLAFPDAVRMLAQKVGVTIPEPAGGDPEDSRRDAALREGLLYDMIGRAEHRDPRTASIAALAQRYAVDLGQAERVETTAMALFDKVAGDWQLGHVERDWLLWAARIHEIGLAIAHSQHHVHGAYIVENSDLAGFARHEQQVLAAMLRCHRRKPDDAVIRALPERLRRPTARVTALLRLAVLLQRGRAADPAPPIELQADDRQLQIRLPQAWLERHPLTRADLDQERDYLKQFDIKLQVRADEKLAAA